MENQRNKIKVCVVVNELLRGGAQRIILDIAKNINRDVFDFFIITLKKESVFQEANLLEEFASCNCPVFCADGDRKISWQEFKNLVSILKKEKPDIIHTYLPYAGILGRIAGRVCCIGKIISTQCNLPVAYDRRSYWLDRLTLPLARVWTGAAEGIEISYGKSVNYFSLENWQKGLRHFTVVAGVDTDSIKHTIEVMDKQRKKEKFGLNQKDKIIFMMARFVAWKGHKDLISAMAFLPKNTQLLLAGWGNLQESFEKLSEETGVRDRVHFIGARSDSYEILGISDVFVQPYSRQPNGRLWMGPNTSQMEACAAGVPSVSTQVPLIEFLIEDNISGRLAKLNDPEDLAKKIGWLLEHPDEARQMAQNAKERIEKKYSVKVMLNCYEGLYRALAGC